MMRILLLEDHALFARSLELAFERFEMIELTSVTTIDAFWNAYDENDYDVLLLDINIGKDNGLELAEDVLSETPGQKIIILSGFDLPHYRMRAYEIGVSAFVHKSESIQTLAHVIEQVHDGSYHFQEAPYQPEQLTEREIEILTYIAQGITQQAIAEQLGLSRRTINNHIQSIIDKMQVNNSIQAVVKASQLGIVRLEDL